eukprot:scaffold173875_cov38-Prasinocladus_malaysianus.AAC.1
MQVNIELFQHLDLAAQLFMDDNCHQFINSARCATLCHQCFERCMQPNLLYECDAHLEDVV